MSNWVRMLHESIVTSLRRLLLVRYAYNSPPAERFCLQLV